MKHSSRYALAALASLPTTAAFACATCGCSLSTDAAMGYSSATGWSVGIEYDYLDQDQLRHGGSAISPARVAAINNAGGDQEVEKDTANHYTTLDLGYAPSPDWNFKLMVPYVDRNHTTYGNSPNPLTPDLISGASYGGLGDIKFITSWQGLLPTNNLGFQLGIKLPTGDYGGPSADGLGVVGRNPRAFTSGPLAGNLVDTSLQPGTGSTDLIVGAYYYQPVSQDFDAFVNGQFQAAVSHKLDQPGADFRPGNLATVSVGLRYEANPTVVPQLQLNLTHKSHDQGALSDDTDSAGTVAYLSPGVTVNVAQATYVYTFVQLPVYRQLVGYQLSPRWTASVGLTHMF